MRSVIPSYQDGKWLVQNPQWMESWRIYYNRWHPDAKINDVTQSSAFFFQVTPDILNFFNGLVADLMSKYQGQLHPPVDQVDESYVLRLQYPDPSFQQKFLFVGDINGCFHALFRTLCRWHACGYMDMSSLRMAPGYTAVFLGDYLNKKMFSLETMVLLCSLFAANLDTHSVIMLRGHMEDVYYNFSIPLRTGGSLAEIQAKGANHAPDAFMHILTFLTHLPAALLIVLQNGFQVWCSHSLFPYNMNYGAALPNIAQMIKLTEQDLVETTWTNIDLVNVPRLNNEPLELHQTPQKIRQVMDSNQIHYVIRAHQAPFTEPWVVIQGQAITARQACDHNLSFTIPRVSNDSTNPTTQLTAFGYPPEVLPMLTLPPLHDSYTMFHVNHPEANDGRGEAEYKMPLVRQGLP
jgi:hypothetical protein